MRRKNIYLHQNSIYLYRIMRTADATMRGKIQRLVELGLLSVA